MIFLYKSPVEIEEEEKAKSASCWNKEEGREGREGRRGR